MSPARARPEDALHIRAILNRDGGTLATIDVDAFAGRLADVFKASGATVDVEIVAGADLTARLDAAAADPDVDAIVAGGGDGTVSAAAGAAWRGGKALGVLPAGTMNLFARALGLPLDLDDAALALARGRTIACDIATANGAPFVHQYSVGLQPEIVRERQTLGYSGRLGKMWAGLRAAGRIFARSPTLTVEIDRDGVVERGRFGYVAVSNNLYGEGHMPYAGKLDGGRLGLYRGRPRGLWPSLRLAFDLLRGAWRRSPHLDGDAARQVTLAFSDAKPSRKASLDGELIALAARVVFEIHPGALSVLAPAAAPQSYRRAEA